MRRVVSFVAAMGLATAGISTLPDSARALDVGQWHAHNGHYYAQIEGLTWAEAEGYAAAVDGHLVTINDQAEQDWLAATFTDANIWIGMNDRAMEGTWVWSSGEPITYTDWVPGEPNDHVSQPPGHPYQGEDAAVMNWTDPFGSFGWNDLPEDSRTSAIVELTNPPRSPAFWVGLDCDCHDIAGSGWPDDYPVTVTARDPHAVGSAISVSLTTDADGNLIGHDVLPGVQPGWIIAATDGISTKTHTVANVSITFVDPSSDTMRGTADPSTDVVYAGGHGYALGLYTYADDSGQWFVDVSGVHDITIGSEVAANQTDGDGDFTYTIQVVPALGQLLVDMVADGRLPNAGLANSIAKQAARAPSQGLANHLRDLVRQGVITQSTMDQILGTVAG